MTAAALYTLPTALYLAALGIASIYGLHRYWLVLRYYRTRTRRPDNAPVNADDVALPYVTVQLPMVNEAAVAKRVIDAACRIDYPRDRLQIQVLDDSTEGSASIARQCADVWRARGMRVEYIHRTDRAGYKAGALQAGLARADGELIAVFDADFVPPRDYLMRTVGHFQDGRIGMVQAAWDHLNREASQLTRCQAMYLDAHFQIEHPARNRDGRWFNFNGTAGIWRRQAIEDAGGWSHDTLTEDMDLSYRAQLAGWSFLYLQELNCPAELPPTISAFKTQQHRWTKGTVQTAIKLLPRIVRSGATPGRTIEAMFHLTSPIVYPCVIGIALLMLPAVALAFRPFAHGSLAAAVFGITVLLLATASGATFYAAGQVERGMRLRSTLMRIPMLIALGVGMSVSNTIAVIEALLGRSSPFVRTPKFNATADRHSHAPTTETRPSGAGGFNRREKLSVTLEVLLGLYASGCLVVALLDLRTAWTAPFLLLFAAGYLYVGLTSLGLPQWSDRSRRADASSHRNNETLAGAVEGEAAT